MKTAFRIVALFAVYSGLAFVGDFALGLLLADEPRGSAAVVDEPVDDAPAVRVDVRPEIVARVQVDRSGRCDFTLDREHTIPAADVRLLRIDSGSGDLHVEGDEGLREIVVVERLCASEEAFLDELAVRTVVGDGTVSLETRYPDRDGWNGRASIDLVVLVPAGLAVDIDDSSGSIEVRRTGALRIDDSSGSVSVSDIDGSVDIDDSSSSLDVRGVRGDVRIQDGSGSVDIQAVTGSVRLRDGSGSVEVVDVGVDVLIDEDGSGSIRVRDVGGDFRVARDGSGSIRHSDVRGSVDIPREKRRGR